MNPSPDALLPMRPVPTVNGRHSAAVLFVLAVAVWWHEWVPALLVAVFALWVVVHGRLEGERGEVILRRWRRAWPPPAVALVPLLLAATFVYWRSNVPVTVKLLPLTLNVIALSLVALGGRWRRRAHPGGHHGNG